METFNTTYPPNNINPRFPNDAATTDVDELHRMQVPRSTSGPHTNCTYATGTSNAGAQTSNYNIHGIEADPTHAQVAGELHRSKMDDIKSALQDIKENVKGTLQRDHHHGQDCAKKPQDGKTNPME